MTGLIIYLIILVATATLIALPLAAVITGLYRYLKGEES
jgi:hypothetical protein